MKERWNVLIILFAVRLSMAFQFQSAASISPAIMKEYGVGLGDIGLLISLYLAPGIAFALPGGEIGRRFGDKRVVLFGLALMIAGGLLMAFAPTWHWQIARPGRRRHWRRGAQRANVENGDGLFRGQGNGHGQGDLRQFLAGHGNSVVPDAVARGRRRKMVIAVRFIAHDRNSASSGLSLLAALYRPPLRCTISSNRCFRLLADPTAIRAMVVAGSIWGLFNAALGMVFDFGTTMLVERACGLAAAGSATSLVLWIVSVSVPFGGVLADRTGKHIEIMLVGFGLFAAALLKATRTDLVIPAFVALGVVGGLSAGPIMSLPARVLTPPVRAVGMGIHFTLFYSFVFAAPIVAGILSARIGTAGAAFDLGAFMLVLCFPAYWAFDRLAARATLALASTVELRHGA